MTERLTALQREAPESAALIAARDRNEDLIQALVAARQARRISQRELGEKMGTTQSVVVARQPIATKAMSGDGVAPRTRFERATFSSGG